MPTICISLTGLPLASLDLYLTNREALAVLCSVIKLLLCSPSSRSYSSRCLSIGGSKHEVNHLYWLLRHVIGLWFWLENSPGFGSKRVFPPVNHSGYSSSPTTAAWKLAAIPLCSDSALFHQMFTIRSGPGALQLGFLLMT